MKIYLYSSICFKNNNSLLQWFTLNNILTVNNEMEALGNAYEILYKMYPKHDGYHNHDCKVLEISIADLETIISKVKVNEI